MEHIEAELLLVAAIVEQATKDVASVTHQKAGVCPIPPQLTRHCAKVFLANLRTRLNNYPVSTPVEIALTVMEIVE